MKDNESENLPDEDEVEIKDLDSTDRTSATSFSQAMVRFAQKTPSWTKKPFVFAVLIGLIILIPIIQSGSSSIFKQTSDNSGTAKLSSQLPLVNISVANGTAYILTTDGTLEAHQTKDGKLLWQHQVAFPPSSYLWAENNVLYITWPTTDTGGVVAALRGNDGSFLWEQQVPSPGPFPLIVKDGIVYFNALGGTVNALSSRNGSYLWYFLSGMNTPLDGFLSVANGTATILTKDSVVYVLRASDGSRILHYQVDLSNNNPWAPYVVGNMMYIAHGTNSVQALGINDGKLLWQYSSQSNSLQLLTVTDGIVYINTADGTIKALRDKDGTLLWQYRTKDPVGATPLVDNNVTYITALDGTITALRTSDGSLLWQHKEDSIDLRYSPLLENGVLYFGLSDGSIEALRDSSGSFLWHYTSTSPVFWYPRVVDGIMYIRHMNGTLDVLQMATGKILWRYPANK